MKSSAMLITKGPTLSASFQKSGIPNKVALCPTQPDTETYLNQSCIHDLVREQNLATSKQNKLTYGNPFLTCL